MKNQPFDFSPKSDVLSRKTRLQGDLIILGQTSPLNEEDLLPKKIPPMAFPEKTLLARYAFSQALSRSTALSALEVQLDSYLTSMALLPHTLAQTGKPGMGRTQLIKKLGELMKFRQLLNLNRENFGEVPDFYWGEPELEGRYLTRKNKWRSTNDSLMMFRLLQVTEWRTGGESAYVVPQ